MDERLLGHWEVKSGNKDLGSVDFLIDGTGKSSPGGYFESIVNYKEATNQFNWEPKQNSAIIITWTSRGSHASLTNTIISYTCDKIKMRDELTEQVIELKKK